jgi:Zn-dependent protease
MMTEQTAWSFSIGHWMGVRVRIHMFVLLFAVLCLSLAWQLDSPGYVLSATALPIAIIGAWLAALVIHEAGHFFVAAHFGCEIPSATLLPWGSDFTSTSRPGWARFFIYLAGPASNLFAAAFLSVVLIAFRNDSPITPGFFNLLQPDQLLLNQSAFDDGLRIAIFANWLLAVVNLVPAFLFDGGFILFSVMQAIWPLRSHQRILLHCGFITQVFSIALLAGAMVSQTADETALFPGWLGLSLFALILMFASKAVPRPLMQDAPQASFASYDPSHRRTSPVYLSESSERFMELASFENETVLGLEEESLSSWLRERRQERVNQARENEEIEEQLADEVLEKVHRSGIDSLTPEDRELLNRVSVRLRNRQREEA